MIAGGLAHLRAAQGTKFYCLRGAAIRRGDCETDAPFGFML
ncbi:hypothetical protein SKA53_04898 [Yoonia vestfoldensis SKA53]|uniref:Uncharacterized protein n=1 Tax=Yoonia vestfoldensis SKA53 TaxID=314232 RepID=A3V673_9RHOB|nr:hypothetical protein SKA53_04898 [Yoonia vestfoldensis SKA53]